MKNLITVLVLSITLFSYQDTVAQKADYFTVSGHYFAIAKPSFEKFSKIMAVKDYEAAAIMINSGEIAELPEGVPVYLEDTSWGLVQIRAYGMTETFWTYAEALVKNN